LSKESDMKCIFRATAAISLATSVVVVQATEAPALRPVAAVRTPIATQAMMLGAAWSGKRAVSVGANGVVLLSDDQGSTFRQAHQVPVSSTLTSVSFADAAHGWAVGHWGVVLSTGDGGENWKIQRLSTDEDRPLFAVHFFDSTHGVAVGLWSLVLTTDDGGETWAPQNIAPPPGGKKADLNLLGLFADKQGAIYATAERGQVLRSMDQGHTWTYLDTGYKGSLWAGAVLSDGTLLVGGQRGTLLRRNETTQQWQSIDLQSKSSVTAISVHGDDVLVVGLDGLQAQSRDGGRTFSVAVRPSGDSLTAALATDERRWILLSKRGVVGDAK